MDDWKPIYDEYYWYIDNVGHLHYSNWYGFLIDTYRFEIGNVFKTKEEAIHELEHRKVLAELKQFSSNFEYGKQNYYMYYSARYNKIIISYEEYSQRSDIYFNSREIIEEVVEKIGKENIIQYYFGVKES